MTYVIEYLHEILDQFINPKKRIFFIYIFMSIIIGFLWLKFYEKKSLKLAFNNLFHIKSYLSRSSISDYLLFLINHIILIIVSPLLISQVVLATFIYETLHYGSLSPGLLGNKLSPLTLGFIFTFSYFVIDDLARFFVHNILHRVPILWAFHKVHHSATSLNPLTVYRTHPVEIIIFSIRSIFVQSSIIGCFVFLFGDNFTLITVIGANVFSVVFNMAGANLRHTNIKIRYWNWLEKIIISPYQHQIHHSKLEIHHNKNFGVVFSLWDYIFQSLKTSKELNQLKFGLNDNEEFIYNHSIVTLYIYPFKEIIYLINKYVTKLLKIKHDVLIIKNKRYKI